MIRAIPVLVALTLHATNPPATLPDEPPTQADTEAQAETRAVSLWASSYQTKAKADAVIAKLQRGHFNTVYGMVHWYRAFYPSKQFERADWVTDEFDPVAYMIEQCRQRNWQFFAWFVNARVSSSDAEKYAHQMLVDVDGNRHKERLDYLIPEVREREKRRMLEFAEMYPDVDGLQFDYIRLPFEKDYSYSDIARTAFEQQEGLDPLRLVNEPGRINPVERERLNQRWFDWRQLQITSLVRDVHRESKKIRPEMLVGAAVMSPESRIKNAKQDWPRWVNEGSLDFVKTMYYANNPSNYARHLDFWEQACGDHFDRAVLPLGGSPSRLGDKDGPKRLIPLIEMARERGARGFFIFRYGTMPDELFDVLAEGPFRKQVPPYRLSPRTPVNNSPTP